MKLSAALVLAAVMTAGHCLPLNDGPLTPSEIVQLTKAAYEYALSILPKAQSWPLPDVSEVIVFAETNTDVQFEGKNGEGDSSGWSFNYYKFYPSTSSTRFRLTVSDFAQKADYRMNGTLFGHEVHGEGVIRFDVFGYGYDVSDLRFTKIDNSLQIAVLNMTLVLDGVKFDIGGLKVDTISVKHLETIMEKFAMEKFNERAEEFKKRLVSLKCELNERIYGHSVEKVIQWLRANTKRGVNNSRFIENLFVPRFVMSEECIRQNHP